jgi:hypothetical protein
MWSARPLSAKHIETCRRRSKVPSWRSVTVFRLQGKGCKDLRRKNRIAKSGEGPPVKNALLWLLQNNLFFCCALPAA